MENNIERSREKEPILKDKIRLDIIFNTLVANRKKYILPLALTMVLTALMTLSIPRYYSVKVMLAPEYDNGQSLGGFGGLASLVGINTAAMGGSDAINPTFYPDLMASTDFLVPLMRTRVATADSSFSGTYVDYLVKKQKFPWWMIAMDKVQGLFKKKLPPMPSDKDYQPNPFALTLTEYNLVQAIGHSIQCTVDKKTQVITLTTTAQDPLIAAVMADTIQQHLQDFITNYRTSKARNDLKHISALCEEARQKYTMAQQEYADFVDSHRDLSMQAYRVIGEKYENEAELAHNSYNALLQQKVLAEAKVQERTPAFTTLQNASVPVRHAGPKRMMAVLVMTFLAFIVTSVYIVVKR